MNLLGACTTSGSLYVIIEYCPHGNLKTFLQGKRDCFQDCWFKNECNMGNEATYIDLGNIAFQVARGMDFLSSKKVSLIVG